MLACWRAWGGTTVYTRELSLGGQLGRSAGEWLAALVRTYADVIFFYTRPYYYKINTLGMDFLYALSFAACGILVLLRLIKGKYRSVGGVLLMVLLVALLPLAMNTFNMIDWSVYGVHILMRHSYALPMVFFLYLLENAQVDVVLKKLKATVMCSWVLLLASVLLIFNYWVLANSAYMNMALNYDRSLLLANRILYTMESTEGYSNQLPVYFHGYFEDNYPSNLVGMDWMQGLGAPAMFLAYGHQAYLPGFMFYELGVTINSTLPPGMEDQLQKDPRVLDMPLFPQPGYVQIIDGILVVKLGNMP